MSFFGKKFVFKYKKIIDKENNRLIEYPAVNLVLRNGEESFETVAIVDSGSDTIFISEEVAEVLKLQLGNEGEAEALGGNKIKVRPSKVDMALVRGRNSIRLGSIPVDVGIGIREQGKDMGIILGRNPIFDLFKITFEQSKKRIVFEKVNLKWYPY